MVCVAGAASTFDGRQCTRPAGRTAWEKSSVQSCACSALPRVESQGFRFPATHFHFSQVGKVRSEDSGRPPATFHIGSCCATTAFRHPQILTCRNGIFPFPILWVHPALHLRLHGSSAFTHARAQTLLVPTSTPNQALPIRCPTSTSPPLPPFEDDGCEKNSCRRTTPPTSPPPCSDFITYAHCDDRIPC